MTDEMRARVEAVRTMVNGSTPGPWATNPRHLNYVFGPGFPQHWHIICDVATSNSEVTQEFIAAAPDTARLALDLAQQLATAEAQAARLAEALLEIEALSDAADADWDTDASRGYSAAAEIIRAALAQADA